MCCWHLEKGEQSLCQMCGLQDCHLSGLGKDGGYRENILFHPVETMGLRFSSSVNSVKAPSLCRSLASWKGCIQRALRSMSSVARE